MGVRWGGGVVGVRWGEMGLGGGEMGGPWW